MCADSRPGMSRDCDHRWRLRHRTSQLVRPVTANEERPGPGSAVAVRTVKTCRIRADLTHKSKPKSAPKLEHAPELCGAAWARPGRDDRAVDAARRELTWRLRRRFSWITCCDERFRRSRRTRSRSQSLMRGQSLYIRARTGTTCCD